MPPLALSTTSFTQFGDPGETFCLITNAGRPDAVRCEPGAGYRRTMTLELPPGAQLAELLADAVPEDAHVLVACPGRFLDSPAPGVLGRRKLAVVPAGSTPITAEYLSYFLDAAARTDAVGQGRTAAEFFERVEQSESLLIVDDSAMTEAGFDHTAGECVWNQQAGVLEPGEQQIAPGGELSAMPGEVDSTEPDARLVGLNGTLNLHGWPIVHRGADPADEAEQSRVFEALSVLVTSPVRLRVAAGVIEDVTAASDAARPAARILTELMDADPRYRTVWELGFGINTGMELLPANCGPNEVYGGAGGVVHVGLGLTPATRFALTFLCPRSSLLSGDGTPILGARKALRTGRMRRVSSASCGCH